MSRPVTPPARPAVPASPASPAERAVLVIDLARQLTALIARETAAVQAGDHGALASLGTGRQTLTARFEDLARLVRLDRTGVAGLAASLRAELVSATNTLSAAAAAHEEFLVVQGEAQRRLVDGLARSLNRERRADTGYGRSRAPARSALPLRRPAAITIDTRL